MVRIDQHFEGFANQFFVTRDLNPPLALLQNSEAAAFLFLGNGIGHGARGGVGPRRIFKREHAVVANRVKQRERVFKISLGFAREIRR